MMLMLCNINLHQKPLQPQQQQQLLLMPKRWNRLDAAPSRQSIFYQLNESVTNCYTVTCDSVFTSSVNKTFNIKQHCSRVQTDRRDRDWLLGAPTLLSDSLGSHCLQCDGRHASLIDRLEYYNQILFSLFPGNSQYYTQQTNNIMQLIKIYTQKSEELVILKDLTLFLEK